MIKDECAGKFDQCDPVTRELVLELLAGYHYRNRVRHPDGSMGEIHITPAEMRDLLAFVITSTIPRDRQMFQDSIWGPYSAVEFEINFKLGACS